MSGLVVAIPWRPSGSYEREVAFDYVHGRLLDLDVTGVATFDADPLAPFSRGRSANLAFGAAKAMGADVVIVNDADMILPEESYYSLWTTAMDSGTLIVGFDDYRALGPRKTNQVYAGGDPFQLGWDHRLHGFSVGGVFAMTVSGWEAVGGFDPRFAGWGMEDWAFAHASKLILGPFVRLEGPGVHLFHPDEKDRWPAERAANVDLLARYAACTTADQALAIRAEVL